jgi:MoaA/NifB/PqqE/SkfB family radical SAM enzyme
MTVASGPRRRRFVEWDSPLCLVQEAVGRLLYMLPPVPTRVQLEVTNRCNLCCRMCPRQLYRLPAEDLELERFRRLLDDLPAGVRRIILVGWGESLLHPELDTMIRLVRESGREAQLTTNALLLRGEHLDRLLAHPPDYLAFSVDAVEGGGDGHPLGAAQDRIRQVLAARRSGAPPFVSFQTTMHAGPAGREEVLRVIRLAAELGVERVMLLRLDVRYVPGLRRPAAAEERELWRAAEALGDKLGVSVEHTLGLGRTWARWLYRLLRPWLYRRDRYCAKTFDYLYVTARGEVTPCCALPRYVVGHVDEGLEQVWTGPRMRHFRRHQAEICGACDAVAVHHRHDGSTLMDPAAGARGEPRPCRS